MSVTTSPPAFAEPLAATSSPSAFTDPLAEDVLAPPSLTQASQAAVRGERPRRDPITRDRSALIAPDVEGQTGTDAIELVRSSGLIAAIETVQIAEDAQQGRVIEQDPAPGTQMVREGVLTLRVAQPPAEPQGTNDDDPAAQNHAESGTAAENEGEDDTEQWFAALEPTLDNSALGPDARPFRRRRKHRRAPVRLPEMVFDTPPDPLPAASDSPTEELPNLSRQPAAYDPPAEERPHQSPQPAGPGLFTSVIAAVLVRLPDPSLSRTWRRRALVLVGAIVGLVLLTRVGASHSHHQAVASLATAPASRPRVLASPASPHPRHRLAARRVPQPHNSQRRDVPARRRTPPRLTHEPVVAAATAADPIPTESGSSSPPPAPAPGPFVYLGK